MTQTLVANGVTPLPYEGFDRMPLGGEWRGGRSGRVSEDRDPYSDEILVHSPLAGRILPSDIPGKENRVYRQPVGVG